MPIQFFNEDISFQLANEQLIASWIINVCAQHEREIEEINYIFCSDEYLLGINQQYLHHDYYTDIITFDHGAPEADVLSDIYISIDRVKENAEPKSFEDELHRVMIHGILHLLGYKDKSESDQKSMRQKEDTCLSLLTK